ncbi:hypothetical protein Tco_0535244 [Tanacetum coccineum]
MRLRLFQFSLHDQASNWLERLPAGSITTWESYYSFPAHLSATGRTAKLHKRNPDVPTTLKNKRISLRSMDSFSRTYPKSPSSMASILLQMSRVTSDAASSEPKINPMLMESSSCSDEPDLIQSEQKHFSSCEICSGFPTTLHTAGNSLPKPLLNMHPRVPMKQDNFNNQSNLKELVSNFMASQDARLSKFEADFKQQQSEMTNKIDTELKAITDRIAGTLPSDTVKIPKLNVNTITSILSACSYPTKDPQCSTHTHSSINTITIHPKQQSDSRNTVVEER